MPTSFLVADDTSTPFTSGSSGVAVVRATATPYAGSPIGALAGVVGNLVMNTTNNTLWECTSSGSSGQSQWLQVLTDPGLYALLAGANIFTQPQTINVPSGFSGKVLLASIGGSNLLYVDQAGNITTVGGLSASAPLSAPAAAANGQAAIVGDTNTGGIGFTGQVSAAAAAANGQVAVVGDTNTGGIGFTGTVAGAASAASGDYVTQGQVQGSGIVTEGGIASGAIHRAQLSTATASSNVSIGGNSVINFSLVGGTYSWFTFINGSGGEAIFNYSTAGAGTVGLANFGSSNVATTDVFENYINSSPPYNFGEAFVYVAYDKEGKIVGISAALDPTWAHHGAHSIVPTHWREIGKPGTKGYRRAPMVYQDMLDGMIFSEAMKDAFRRLAFLKGELTPERGEVEITVDFKDLDKESHPHPFGSDSVARVVLMHPEGPLANRITDMLKASHASEIVKMIEDGDLLIQGDGIIHPHAPSTIQVVQARLR